jgi:type II secretory pathway pseudopilin PulG
MSARERSGRPGPCAAGRARRSLTLVELLAVIAILAILVLVGGGLGSAIMAYHRARGGAETLLNDIRAIQEYAASRQNIPHPAGSSGIKFFASLVRNDRTGPQAGTIGWSYVTWGAQLRNHPRVDKPSGPMAGSQPYLPYVRNLPAGVQLRTDPGRAVADSDTMQFDLGRLSSGLAVVHVTEPSAGTFTIRMWGPPNARTYAALSYDPNFFP